MIPELRAIYRAQDAEAGLAALDAFEVGPWGTKYPAVAPAWRRNWDLVIPFFAFPEAVRRIIYTTNAIEALNSKLRRAIRARGHFPNDEAATKLLYLVLNRAAADWKRPPREWIAVPDQMNATGPRTEFLTVPRQPSSGEGNRTCTREDRQGRCNDPRSAACRWLPAGGLGCGRRDTRTATPGLGARGGCALNPSGEEPGACRAARQPDPGV